MDMRNPQMTIMTKLVLIMTILMVSGCSSTPQVWKEGEPAHHVNGGFRNYPVVPEPPPIRSFFYLRRFWTSFVLPDLPVDHVIPEEKALEQFSHYQSRDSVTWLGQSTFIIKLDGVTILTDPYLTTYASSVWGIGPRRFVPPGITIENLPPIDIIILSHNHLDHLDAETVESIKDKDSIQVYVPLGLRSFFIERGYSQVEELDWNEQRISGPLKLTALPTIHHSGRSIGDKNETLWCSWSIQSSSQNLYFIGDSGYSTTTFKAIGEKMGPFDVALLTIGAYKTRQGDPVTHLYPEDAVKVGLDLKAETLVGMHWGTIQLSDEPPFEPPVRFRKAAAKAGYSSENIWVMKIGETRSSPTDRVFEEGR